MDSQFLYGGGTDDTAVLQAMLDTAADGVTNLYLIMDGCALVSGLKIYSNTTIVGKYASGGFYLAAGSNKPVLTGGTPSKTVRTDQNIKLWNLYINGNGGSQADTAIDGTVCVGVSFYSVKDFTMLGCHVQNSRMWGVALWNSENTLIEDHTHTAVGTRLTQDGVNLRSTTLNAILRNLTIHSYDDAIALNNIHWGDYGGPYVEDGGVISGVTIDGLIMDDALFGIDILSDSSLIDDVTISNVSGSVRNYWLAISNYQQVTGDGNFGTISCTDVDTQTIETPYGGGGAPYYYYEHVRLMGNIGNLSLVRCRLNQSVDDRPYIRVWTGFTVTNFTLTDLVIDGDLVVAPSPVILLDGTVTNKLGNSWPA